MTWEHLDTMPPAPAQGRRTLAVLVSLVLLGVGAIGALLLEQAASR
jgi:Tfp pilus assembly protein PilV